jgi:hypothetical protein
MAADMTDTRADEEMIERDIERTQDQMGETVQKLEDSLDPREMARSLMGDENTDLVKDALDLARQNPIPVAMIAVGAIWLLASSSRSPAVRRLTDQFRSKSGSSSSSGDLDPNGLRPRSAEPAPIGPPPATDPSLDRMPYA